ncbi:MAG: capsular biosynthesis protein [Bdellovibrionales bacterium]
MKRLVMDLDHTLTTEPEGDDKDYASMPVNEAVAEKVRAYKKMGYQIIIYSSRNMRTYQGSVGHINAHTLPIIHAWLVKNDIPFDEIHVGKPWCGHEGFYVDDKAIRPDEFLSLSDDEIQRLVGNTK